MVIEGKFCNIASKKCIYNSTVVSLWFIVFLEIFLNFSPNILKISKYQPWKILKIYLTFKL